MQPDHNDLARLAALIETERMQRRITAAQAVVRQALQHCPGLVVSMSGGKDSVAAGIIARSVDRQMPMVIATPPNALPYRAGHVADLKAWFGGEWREVDYGWDVDRVLDGLRAYPASRKVEVLTGLGLPGVVMGLRNSESRARQINYRMRGAVYQTRTGWRCLPIAGWSGEEVVALAIYFGAPVAEVYRLPLLGLRLDDIRDGTWWAHRNDAATDDWMRRSYPTHHAHWLRSSEIALGQGWRED